MIGKYVNIDFKQIHTHKESSQKCVAVQSDANGSVDVHVCTLFVLHEYPNPNPNSTSVDYDVNDHSGDASSVGGCYKDVVAV
ncbi:Hypothetical predicted protein [Octopus vulgaris]|uniref:Uncharacterized protein n=1 Tax=Octopus vulgaris TaxID=6645 RepID=A0AA36F721_OCTVU|nr:Hypothetical predicted protein [Octopus vulgaris]